MWSGSSVQPTSRIKKQPKITPERSKTALDAHSFWNLAKNGKLKVTGIASYLSAHPNIYYCFYPQFRVAGTLEEIHSAAATMSYDPSAFDAYLLGYDQHQHLYEMHKTGRTEEPEYVQNIAWATYVEELSEYGGKEKKTFPINENYNPFKELILFAGKAGISIPSILEKPLILNDLIEQQRQGISRTTSLFEHMQTALSKGKGLNVSKLTDEGKGARQTNMAVRMDRAKNKRSIAHLPGIASDNIPAYLLAVSMLRAGQPDDSAHIDYETAIREVTGLLGGYMSIPQYQPPTSPRLESPRQSPRRAEVHILPRR